MAAKRAAVEAVAREGEKEVQEKPQALDSKKQRGGKESGQKAAGEARDGGIYSFHRSNRSSHRYVAEKREPFYTGKYALGRGAVTYLQLHNFAYCRRKNRI